MNEYVGKICPYCKSVFTESDDIVVCSECDMPHHKDCWIENQGCTTFGCIGSIKAADGSATTVTESQLEYEDAGQPEQNVFCTQCGRKNDIASFYCSGCGARLTTNAAHTEAKHTFTPAASGNANPYGYTNQQSGWQQQSTPYGNTSAAIDADIVQLVGANSEYYVPKFQKLKSQNKKSSWNWCAFLVTPYWLIFRKMYGYAAGVLAGAFVISLIGSGFLLLLAFAGYVVFGFYANYIYMNYLAAKANQAKVMSEPYRTQFIAKNSGVNSTATILTVVGYTLLVLIISL